MGYAFISYSTKNQQMADSFKTLFNQNGVATWMAPGDIPFGSTYTSTINRAIKGASCFVLLLSESAQGSQWVLKETERAVSTGKTIFTVMLDDVPLNDDFEFVLSTSQAVAIRRINKNDDNIKRLLQAVITYTGESKIEEYAMSQDSNNGMVNGVLNRDDKIDNENYFKDNAVIEGTVLKRFKGRLSAEVVIPEGITVIGARAFAFYPELLGISIPSSVKKIEEYAFIECPKLRSITVNPQNPVFRSEGNCCIERATNNLLFGCYTSQIPDGVTVICKDAFNGCKNLTSIIIPNSVTRIEESAFFQCTNLENISLSDGLTSIGNLAFCDCYSLVDLIIPANVTKISGNAFYKCYGLESIQVDPNNSVYHSKCNCCIETNINSLVLGCKNSGIPDGTVVIGEAAFGGCTGLKKIEIPSSVTEIGYEAFCGCEHLEKLVISVGIEKICTKAFMNCSALKELFIPASVSEIEAFAFSGCTSLRSIKVSSENSVYYSEDHCCIRSGDCALVLGCMNSIIPDGITEIGDDAFCDCYGLTDIYLPESITKIGKGAFSGSGLTSIEIPKHVEFIGSFAFHQCNELMSIIIPNSVKYIGELAFSGFDYASEKRDVFCETSKKPNRWHREWTDEDSVVHWKVDWDYDENGLPMVKTRNM